MSLQYTEYGGGTYKASGSYTFFREHDPEPGRKTCWYEVTAQDGFLLGHIRWFSRWRKFSFDPQPNTTFEETCLRDIAEFIQTETRNYKKRTV